MPYIIRIHINKLLEKRPFVVMPDDCSERRFLYIFLITCLFHDLGYIYEEGGKLTSSSDFSLPPKRYTCGIPNIYTKDLVYRYIRYRESEFGVKDHGIYGGMAYYSQMCELRGEKEDGASNLFWGVDMEKVYAYISWIIICHNIFFYNRIKSVNKDKEKLYISYGLKGLIVDNPLISISKHPFLYLFCMLDSIEPLKKIKEVDKLKDIKILFKENKIILNTDSLCDSLAKILCESVESLGEWIDSPVVKIMS